MNTKLFIANKIKVGFNPRTDTYTGLLGYVIGHDGKKWRKEPSWEGWRYSYIDEAEYQQKRKEQYDNLIITQKKNHANYVQEYKTNPNRHNWYKEYAEMTEEAFLKKHVGDYENFKPNLGRISSDEKIKPVEFENIPTEGFVLNKKAGGYSSGWNHRSTYCRVYDPRGFEFEISIPNLLFILQECNAMRGKGLEGEFVYAWDGKDLVLLPTNCDEYKSSTHFTKLQSGKVSTKDLVEGCTYQDKQLVKYIYLGKFNWFKRRSAYSEVNKNYVFYLLDKRHSNQNPFVSFSSLSSFSQKLNDVAVSNYAELMDEFNKSEYSGKLSDISFNDIEIPTMMRYRTNDALVENALLDLGNNTYQIYKITGNAGTSRSSYPYQYDVKDFNLSTNKTLVLKGDGDFSIKTTTLKTQSGVSKADLIKLNLKMLRIENNNKTQTIHF